MSARSSSPADLAELRRRLDVLVFLFLETGPEPSKSVAKKIGRLVDLGLTDAEIGGIVGKKQNYVGAVRSRLKRKR